METRRPLVKVHIDLIEASLPSYASELSFDQQLIPSFQVGRSKPRAPIAMAVFGARLFEPWRWNKLAPRVELVPHFSNVEVADGEGDRQSSSQASHSSKAPGSCVNWSSRFDSPPTSEAPTPSASRTCMSSSSSRCVAPTLLAARASR